MFYTNREGKVKTTKADYELFEKEVKRWIDFWGLTEWDVSFNHENPRLKDVDAGTRYSYADKWVVFGLTDEIHDYEYSKDFVKKCAFHEAAELLIAELVSLCQMRTVTDDDIVRAAHCVIMRLQNRVFK